MEAALHYLDRHDFTAQRLTEKLLKNGFPAETVAECIDRLQGWGYLNDREYGIRQVKALQIKLKSRCYVEEYLLHCGLERQLVTELIESYYPETVEAAIAEKLIARKFINKPASSTQKIQYLLRAGFLESTVRQCFSDGSST